MHFSGCKKINHTAFANSVRKKNILDESEIIQVELPTQIFQFFFKAELDIVAFRNSVIL